MRHFQFNGWHRGRNSLVGNWRCTYHSSWWWGRRWRNVWRPPNIRRVAELVRRHWWWRIRWLWVSRDFAYSTNGSFRSHQVNKSQWPTTNLMCLYLFSLFIPCPALFFLYFFSIASHTQTSESSKVMLVSTTPQICSLVTKFSQIVVFSSSDPSRLFSMLLVF